MTLEQLFANVPIHSRLVLEVVDNERKTLEERKAEEWCDDAMPKEFAAFSGCELFDIHGDVSGVLRIIVTSQERIEKRGREGWFYYAQDGQKYELAGVVTPDGSADHDMILIMKWFEDDDSFGYNLIDYFVGGAEMSDDELLKTCRYYVNQYREKNN